MKKHHYLKALVTFGLIFLFYWLILSFTSPHSAWRAIMLLIWGSISLSKISFSIRGQALCLLLSYLNFYLGSILLTLFSLWLVNLILKALNPLFFLLDWSFRIGNLFNDPHQYLFSLPALICGSLLVAAAFLSQSDAKYHILRYTLEFGGKNFKS